MTSFNSRDGLNWEQLASSWPINRYFFLLDFREQSLRPLLMNQSHFTSEHKKINCRGDFEITRSPVWFDFSLRRPLIKLSISWRKNGVLVTSGLSDFNRRLTILSPVVSDAGFYECEAILRSSSVPSVSAGAYLHVLGKTYKMNDSLKHGLLWVKISFNNHTTTHRYSCESRAIRFSLYLISVCI